MERSPTVVRTMRLVYERTALDSKQKKMRVGHVKSCPDEEIWVSDELKKLVVRAFL